MSCIFTLSVQTHTHPLNRATFSLQTYSPSQSNIYNVRAIDNSNVKPGVSGKMAVVNGAALLVLTFEEEQLDLKKKKS